MNVWIFRHNFVDDKAKIRRRAVALQGFLTKSPAKFDEKTCINLYVDRFSVSVDELASLKYIANPEKTDNGRLIFTQGCCSDPLQATGNYFMSVYEWFYRKRQPVAANIGIIPGMNF